LDIPGININKNKQIHTDDDDDADDDDDDDNKGIDFKTTKTQDIKKSHVLVDA